MQAAEQFLPLRHRFRRPPTAADWARRTSPAVTGLFLLAVQGPAAPFAPAEAVVIGPLFAISRRSGLEYAQ
jgi:hypothetical protein